MDYGKWDAVGRNRTGERLHYRVGVKEQSDL